MSFLIRFTAWISIKDIIKGNFILMKMNNIKKIFFTDLIGDHASPLLYKMYIHKSFYTIHYNFPRTCKAYLLDLPVLAFQVYYAQVVKVIRQKRQIFMNQKI